MCRSQGHGDELEHFPQCRTVRLMAKTCGLPPEPFGTDRASCLEKFMCLHKSYSEDDIRRRAIFLNVVYDFYNLRDKPQSDGDVEDVASHLLLSATGRSLQPPGSKKRSNKACQPPDTIEGVRPGLGLRPPASVHARFIRGRHLQVGEWHDGAN